MTEKQYKVINNNLGEYSVLRLDGSIVATEIQYKAEAELFCDELNELNDENQRLKFLFQSERRDLIEQNNNYRQSLNEIEKKNEHLKVHFKKMEKLFQATNKENEELISIKCFADRHGINIFNIDEAFRRCWNDNGDLVKENQKLKTQLLHGDGVCDICKYEYLVKTDKYYVSKCKKEHEECSKIDLVFCEDFEVKELNEKVEKDEEKYS